MQGVPSVFRTNNPVDFTRVDGVFIDERRPPGRIQALANDIVCVVGEFERGPVDEITAVGSSSEFARIFGSFGPDSSGAPYKGWLAVASKRFGSGFGRLRVIRVSNVTQVTATANLEDAAGTPVDVIRIDAQNPGKWGNRLSASIEAATDDVAGHFNLRVLFEGRQVEIHRNLDLASVADNEAFPLQSDWIVATRLAIGDGRPVNVSATALATGADGSFVDADVIGSSSDVRGLELLRAVDATNIRYVVVAENESANVNAALVTLAEDTKTKISCIAGPPSQTKAQAKTDVASYRSDRVVYAYPWVRIFVPGVNGLVTVSPASFAAAAIATLPPGTDPAGVNSESLLTGIRELADKSLNVNDYIDFAERGIMGLAFAAERERWKFWSGVTTSLDPSLQMILRRTMTDFLQESMGRFLTAFQNLPLRAETKESIKAAIEDFLERQQSLGLLPTARDLVFADGNLAPFEVDIVSGNTAEQEALGLFVVFVRVRIFSSMRFIVLRTEIGEGVELRVEEVTGQAA